MVDGISCASTRRCLPCLGRITSSSLYEGTVLQNEALRKSPAHVQSTGMAEQGQAELLPAGVHNCLNKFLGPVQEIKCHVLAAPATVNASKISHTAALVAPGLHSRLRCQRQKPAGPSRLFGPLTFSADAHSSISPALPHRDALFTFAHGVAWARPRARARLCHMLQMRHGPDSYSMSDAALCTMIL